MTEINAAERNPYTLALENIILIGMPGAGKSSIGPLLAEKKGFAFVDTDLLVKEKDGRELKNIVLEDGFEAFLEIQRKTITLQAFKNCVIATGGSVVMDSVLMQFLKQCGYIIYLELDFDTLEQRLLPDRRLARSGGQTFRQLFEQREPLYKKYSDSKIVCAGKSPIEIADGIHSVLKYRRTNSNG